MVVVVVRSWATPWPHRVLLGAEKTHFNTTNPRLIVVPVPVLARTGELSSENYRMNFASRSLAPQTKWCVQVL